MGDHKDALTAYAKAFVTELVQAGVKYVVISPGSRSTPLAMIIAENKNLQMYVHVDERSAAFFALGIAKATGMPTAILCTSGTAAANYYPAIVEANISRVPLLVLTADRPHELRDIGAPQAIDQINLYGKHVKWFVEMALPENTPALLRYVRTVSRRAVSTALQAPAGPVHLNFPFREPLIPHLGPTAQLSEENRPDGYVDVHQGVLSLSERDVQELATELEQYKKGVILCGPNENKAFMKGIIDLAKALQFPLLADPLSQLRSGRHDDSQLITAYDAFLKEERAKEELKPDVIIRFGAMPVSKSVLLYLERHRDVPQWIVDGGGGWRDPSITSSEMIYADEQLFCQSLLESIPPKRETDWIQLWKKVDDKTKSVLSRVKKTMSLSEGKLAALLEDILPAQATLFVGNSMPIRDVDTFFHFNKKEITMMANRGANGIDGVVSTALGVAAIKEHVYLLVGDLTFFHDLNGLLAAKLYDINLTIIVINNNGGGIFSFLPQANHTENFERLFGTPLNIDFSHVVHMYGGQYVEIASWDDLDEAMKEASVQGGLSVIEMPTNRVENVQEHRALWGNVSREIKEVLGENE